MDSRARSFAEQNQNTRDDSKQGQQDTFVGKTKPEGGESVQDEPDGEKKKAGTGGKAHFGNSWKTHSALSLTNSEFVT